MSEQANLAELVGDVLDERQPPGPNADKIIAEETGNAVAGGSVDGGGDDEGFDPALHETEPTTKRGIKNIDGTWRKKRGRGAVKARPLASPAAEFPPAQEIPAGPLPLGKSDITPAAGAAGEETAVSASEARQSAIATIGIVVSVAQGYFGDEWEPLDKEAADMIESLTSFYHAYQFAPVGPGFAVMAAVAAYAGPRLSKPKTQGKLAGLKARVAGWWNKLRGAARKKIGILGTSNCRS